MNHFQAELKKLVCFAPSIFSFIFIQGCIKYAFTIHNITKSLYKTSCKNLYRSSANNYPSLITKAKKTVGSLFFRVLLWICYGVHWLFLQQVFLVMWCNWNMERKIILDTLSTNVCVFVRIYNKNRWEKQ